MKTAWTFLSSAVLPKNSSLSSCESTMGQYLGKSDIELNETLCPYCKKPVRWYWKRNGGFLSRPSVTLIADTVYHSVCFDIEYDNWNL